VIFPFRCSDVQPNPAYPSRVIFRPEIPIWASVGGARAIPLIGLLDTGSDDTKFPLSLADRIGAKLDRAHPVSFHGVGGLAMGYYGDVILELRRSRRSYRWAACVAFLPEPQGLSPEEGVFVTLGHAGFFRYFHASFDYQRGRVKVWPNGLYQGLSR
jgi:hypothetical protein